MVLKEVHLTDPSLLKMSLKYANWRWQPRWHSTTSSFVLNVVTLFRSLKSIYRPNFIYVLIYNYFGKKQPSAMLEFYFQFQSWLYHCALGCRISSNQGYPQRKYDVISIFKMAAAVAQFYFRFQIGWRRSFSHVSFYQQTKFHSCNSIRGWDITISGLEKNVRHTGLLLPVSISTIWPQSACHSAPICQI